MLPKLHFIIERALAELRKEELIYVNSKIKVKNSPLNDFFLNDFKIFNLNILSCREIHK